jgi:serine/threonine protein kinase
MELAEFSLADYIDYRRGDARMSGIVDETMFCWPHLVSRGSSAAEQTENMCEIGPQLAQGLEFLHRFKLVHRDLKPSNGMVPWVPHSSLTCWRECLQ